jgi:hypothetical protein
LWPHPMHLCSSADVGSGREALPGKAAATASVRCDRTPARKADCGA